MTQTNTWWLTDRIRQLCCLQKLKASNRGLASKKINSWHIAHMMHWSSHASSLKHPWIEHDRNKHVMADQRNPKHRQRCCLQKPEAANHGKVKVREEEILHDKHDKNAQICVHCVRLKHYKNALKKIKINIEGSGIASRIQMWKPCWSQRWHTPARLQTSMPSSLKVESWP